MKNQTRQMIKNAIQENVIAFKDSTAKVLYSKINQKLTDQYKAVAQSLLKPKQ